MTGPSVLRINLRTLFEKGAIGGATRARVFVVAGWAAVTRLGAQPIAEQRLQFTAGGCVTC